MRLVMLGMPGAGKGTQGELLAQKYGIPHISTGNMFREALQSDTEVGRRARVYMERGELVPDDIAIQIVQERVAQPDCEAGFTLDGFPRTVAQAQSLDGSLNALNRGIEAVVHIRITAEEAVSRIADRRVCEQCGATYHRTYQRAQGKGICDTCGGPLVQRPDDTAATARRRLEVYLEQTYPVVAHYENLGLLAHIDGEQDIEKVFADLCSALEVRGVSAEAGGRR